MRKGILYIILLLLIGACASVGEIQYEGQAQDWTIFRGSPSLCGYTDCELPDRPILLWSTSTQSRTVASPIVYNGITYVLNRKGELRGYTLEGELCASHNFNTPVEASFIVSDSMLYVGRIDGFVTAVSIPSLLSGRQKLKPVWEFETLGQISGSPNMVGHNLLVGSYDGDMYTFDAATGQRRGQFHTGYYINGTAAVWQRFMLFGGCDSWVRVVDTRTGQLTDSLQLDTYVPASPAVLQGVACAADYNGNIYEMQLTDQGRIASHRKLLSSDTDNDGQDGGSVSMPTLTQDAAYVLSGERHILCIDRKSARVRWRRMLRGVTGECSPLVARDRVLVCTKDGHVSILSTQDGAELWHYEVGEQIIASPAIISDRFFILTARGTLLCFH